MARRRQLPPLNAMRAFEAAARHLSFTKAADELAVTQAAISHQVKQLEDHLGLHLFRRFNRRLELTEQGRAFLPPLREAFDMMDEAARGLAQGGGDGPLRLSVLPSFAAKWLLPRLSRFRAAHPDVDVLVSASNALADLEGDDVDAGIRYGRGNYPGLKVDDLMGDVFLVVCSPRLLEGPHPLTDASRLMHHTLLHDSVAAAHETPGWRDWLRHAGLPESLAKRGPGYSDSSMVLQAAIDGQGVALGRWSLAADDLRAGRLVEPFGPRMPSDFAYYFVCPPRAANWPKITAFREWLIAETRESERNGTPPPEPPLMQSSDAL